MYFNEIDKFCCGVLRKHWPGATVDERDIRQIERINTDRVHLFAGIGRLGTRLAARRMARRLACLDR